MLFPEQCSWYRLVRGDHTDSLPQSLVRKESNGDLTPLSHNCAATIFRKTLPSVSFDAVYVFVCNNGFKRLDDPSHRTRQCTVGAILVIALCVFGINWANTRFAPTV